MLLITTTSAQGLQSPFYDTEWQYDPIKYNDGTADWLEQQVMKLIEQKDSPGCPIDPGITIPDVKPANESAPVFPTCAAFVMDLTGSMTDEIAAIKQVLSNFLTSQLGADNDYCLIFVKVIGPGQSKYKDVILMLIVHSLQLKFLFVVRWSRSQVRKTIY